MDERVKYRPFTGDAERSVKLQQTPLALVLCQVRWPEMSFLRDEALEKLADRLGQEFEDYPVVSRADEVAYSFGPQGVTHMVAGKVFQWASVDQTWHISLARRFVTFHCTEYPGYIEFNRRLYAVLSSVRDLVGVPLIDRVGMRYVNRMSDPNVDGLLSFVRPEVLGFRGIGVESPEVILQGSINQATYTVGDATLQVRSGITGPGETVDPSIPPLPTQSWVLDLDAAIERRAPFDVDAIIGSASHLADVDYDYFKYIIADGFEDHFGKRDS
jgi:uncharacterized protein (TIGR04255 family)